MQLTHVLNPIACQCSTLTMMNILNGHLGHHLFSLTSGGLWRFSVCLHPRFWSVSGVFFIVHTNPQEGVDLPFRDYAQTCQLYDLPL